MAKATDIHELLQYFQDRRVILDVGIIRALELAEDNSVLRVKIENLEDDTIIVARMTWDHVGPGAGIYAFPVPGDMVLYCNVGDIENRDVHSFVLKRLSSAEDTIPQEAKDGSTVIKALSGKNAHLLSDQKVLLGRGGEEAPGEPLVLGNVMLEAMSDILESLNEVIDAIVSGPVGVGNAGAPTPTHPTLISALNQLKSTIEEHKNKYVTDDSTNVVSQHTFGER